MDIGSRKWLGIGEGLWHSLVCELNMGASLSELRGMLDALEWRSLRQVSEGEFSAIFEAWAIHASARPAEDGAEVVGNAMFCEELARRKANEDELTLMFGLVVNETNRLTVARREQKEDLTALRMRLALAEKVFFAMDVEGKGFITLDEVIHVALAKRVREREAMEGQALRFDLGDLATECMELMARFGTDDKLYRGTVTLQRFKECCLGSLGRNKTRDGMSNGNGTENSMALNDMTLQKMLVDLSKLRVVLNASGSSLVSPRNLWNDAIDREFLGELNSPVLFQLSNFLSIRGSRIRWELYKPNQPWGTDHEIQAYWTAFSKGKKPQDHPSVFKKLERTVFRFISNLSSTLSKIFPESFDPSIDIFLTSERDSQRRLEERREGDRWVQQSGDNDSATNDEEDDIDDIGSEVFEDVDEDPSLLLPQEITEENDFRMANEMDENRDVDDLKSLRSAFSSSGTINSSESETSSFSKSKKQSSHQSDGAYYIEAFRLFVAEKIQVYSYSHEEAAELWNSSSIESRKVYVEMARASRKKGVIGSASEFTKESWDMAPCIIQRDHAMYLHEAVKLDALLKEGFESEKENLDDQWRPLDVPSVIEHLLERRFSFTSSEIIDPPFASRTDLGKLSQMESVFSACMCEEKHPLKEGELGFLGGGTMFQPQMRVYFFRLDLSTSSLSRYDKHSDLLNATVPLLGARIGRTLSSSQQAPSVDHPHRFSVLPASGPSWILFASSVAEMDQWIADISFVIAEEAVRHFRATGGGSRARNSPKSVSSQHSPYSSSTVKASSPHSAALIASPRSLSSQKQEKQQSPKFYESRRNQELAAERLTAEARDADSIVVHHHHHHHSMRDSLKEPILNVGPRKIGNDLTSFNGRDPPLPTRKPPPPYEQDVKEKTSATTVATNSDVIQNKVYEMEIPRKDSGRSVLASSRDKRNDQLPVPFTISVSSKQSSAGLIHGNEHDFEEEEEEEEEVQVVENEMNLQFHVTPEQKNVTGPKGTRRIDAKSLDQSQAVSMSLQLKKQSVDRNKRKPRVATIYLDDLTAPKKDNSIPPGPFVSPVSSTAHDIGTGKSNDDTDSSQLEELERVATLLRKIVESGMLDRKQDSFRDVQWIEN